MISAFSCGFSRIITNPHRRTWGLFDIAFPTCSLPSRNCGASPDPGPPTPDSSGLAAPPDSHWCRMREAVLKYGLFSLPPESQVPGRGRQAAGGRLRFGKLAGSRRRPPSVRGAVGGCGAGLPLRVWDWSDGRKLRLWTTPNLSWGSWGFMWGQWIRL